MDEPTLRIGEVAELAGIRASAIRYYERIGLLPEPDRVSGRRVYDRTVLPRLAAIDVGRQAGLRLDEIGELIEAGDGPVSVRMQRVAKRKLPEVEALVEHVRAMREWLEAASRCECVSLDDCALFEAPRCR